MSFAWESPTWCWPGVIQVTDLAVPALRLPEWVPSLVFFFGMIGFPFVLLFAWAFELTPEGIRREQDVSRSESVTQSTGRKIDFAIISLLAVALGFVVWDAYLSEPEAVAVTEKTAELIEPAAQLDKSIAVLPFANRSARPEDAFFVDGIQDDILTKLAKIASLKVISRTSVMQYRDTHKTMKVIGEELGAATLLEGGVQRAGDRVRINMQLINAATDEHLWAETYNMELTAANIFEIQEQIATAIADALRATLSPQEKARIATVPTENMEALEAYFLGQLAMPRRTSAALAEAEIHFKRAIELDPDYAMAYVGLANTYYLQVDYSNRLLAEAHTLVAVQLDQALAINDQLGEAYITRAAITDDREQAELLFKKGIALAPGYATGHQWYAGWLTVTEGPSATALSEIELAARLDPLSAIVRHNLSMHLDNQGRFDEARAQLEAILGFEPGFALAYSGLAYLDYLVDGRLDNAMVNLNKARRLDPTSANNYSALGEYWSYLGARAESEQALHQALSLSPHNTNVLVASNHASLNFGEIEEARDRTEAMIKVTPQQAYRLGHLALNRMAVRAGRVDEALARHVKYFPELKGDTIGDFYGAIDFA